MFDRVMLDVHMMIRTKLVDESQKSTKISSRVWKNHPRKKAYEVETLISVIVRGMPVWVASDCKQYLVEQLQRFGATKRKLQEEIKKIEERERLLLEGW